MGLTSLRRLAEQASPGPWEDDLDLPVPEGLIEAAGGGAVCQIWPHANVNTIVRSGGEYFSHADARYIAAVYPQVVLALVDEVERLRSAFFALTGTLELVARDLTEEGDGESLNASQALYGEAAGMRKAVELAKLACGVSEKGREFYRMYEERFGRKSTVVTPPATGGEAARVEFGE